MFCRLKSVLFNFLFVFGDSNHQLLDTESIVFITWPHLLLVRLNECCVWYLINMKVSRKGQVTLLCWFWCRQSCLRAYSFLASSAPVCILGLVKKMRILWCIYNLQVDFVSWTQLVMCVELALPLCAWVLVSTLWNRQFIACCWCSRHFTGFGVCVCLVSKLHVIRCDCCLCIVYCRCCIYM